MCVRAVLAGLFALAISQGGFPAQTVSETFEVASIRPAAGADERAAIQFTPGGGLRGANVTLKLLVEMAYDVTPEQVTGGAGWTDSERYQIEAKGPPGTTTAADSHMVRRRLQALLADRFHLVLEHENKGAAGYELVISPKGTLVQTSTTPPPGSLRQAGVGVAIARGTTMEILVRFLSVHTRRPVVDKTGLTGGYDFKLSWAPDPEQLPHGVPPANGPSLFTALEEQLGLKLRAQKAGIEHIVITYAERPTPN